ncbi:choice-of-anchor Q domain-containing protein [Spirosoma soli]|uniref:Choice-of-anchor Q domain-containing protein n=1 Tax=Spirosoma soli TaxID=1770529 RepID=A0ABW5M302_9BACT
MKNFLFTCIALFSHMWFTRWVRPLSNSITRIQWCAGLIVTLCCWGVLEPVMGQSTNISFPGFRSSFITGTQVVIAATASPATGKTVTKVEFLLSSAATAPATGTTVLGEDATAPYSFTWAVPAGQLSYNELRTRVTFSDATTLVSSSVPVDVYEPTVASNINYYVAPPPLGTTSNNGLSPSTPLSTIQAAIQLVKPGDVVNVMAGTYTTSGNVVSIRRTGTEANWITLKNYQNDRPVLSLTGANAIQVFPGVAYLRIQGFEIIGNNANVTLPQAYTQPGSCVNPTGTPPNALNGNGISIDGRNGANLHCHHIEVKNNVVHDCGGGGLSAIQSDYITFENNVSYNNSWYTVYGTSGISFLNSWNYDNHPGNAPSIIIRNNRTYGNRLFVRWKNGGANTCRTYDGNGIILDNNIASKNSLGGYTGRFLIENNLSYLNGGRGININFSDNVTIINNTTYQNGVTNTVNSPATGEVTDDIQSEFIAQGSKNISVYNNIFYGRPGEKVTEVNSSTIVHNNNLTFEGTGISFFSGNQNITGQDPQFVDAATSDFRLSTTSPAINVGSAAPGQYTVKDILGIDRPQGAGVDMGAFEFQGPDPLPARFAITSVTTTNCQTVSADLRSVTFTPQYAGLSGQPVSFSVVNEMAPTTNAGPYTLSLYTDNPVVTLKAKQGGTEGDISFSYNWLAACSGNPFAITAVTTVSCQTVSTGERSVTFTPQYAGLSGQPVSFSVVNELPPTTQPGPYTLNLYTDNPTVVLKAAQTGTPNETTFSYNWLSACGGGSGRVGAGELQSQLQVRVLGNPAREQVTVEIAGGEGQALRLLLTDSRGHTVENRFVEHGTATERHVFDLRRQSTGMLLLRVSTTRQTKSIKVLKQ